MSSPIGICYLFDVGQGSSNLIRVGDQVVVVDCGLTGREVLDYLDEKSIERVDTIVLTHNDADHAKGLTYLLEAYEGKIGSLWYQVEYAGLGGDSSGIARRKLLEAIQKAEGEGKIGLSHYLHTNKEYISERIWEKHPARLELLYPLPKDNRGALLIGDPNLSCGVLKLTCGVGSVLFAADAPMEAWRAIRHRFGQLTCDFIAVHHHGGHLHREGQAAPLADRLRELNDLYANGILSRFAVVSVGTTNPYEHPFPEHIHALRQSGAQILCTQLTRRCCPDRSELGAGILNVLPRVPQRSARVTRDIGCAGTVSVDLFADAHLVPRRAADHARAITELCQRRGQLPPRPMCRESPADILHAAIR